VFGQVARVEELTSEVILISDPAHALPVQINRNGLRTIAVGTGDTKTLKLPYLPTSADVVVGDLLVTSGLGGGFPSGYPVGTVAAVKRDPAQSLADVDVRPAAALDRSRELMLVWLKPGAVLPAVTAATPAASAASAAASTQPAKAATAGKPPASKPSASKPSAPKAPAAKAPASAGPSGTGARKP
jgi:rod shape-determining protein MreC